jgi:hypothetical protein
VSLRAAAGGSSGASSGIVSGLTFFTTQAAAQAAPLSVATANSAALNAATSTTDYIQILNQGFIPVNAPIVLYDFTTFYVGPSTTLLGVGPRCFTIQNSAYTNPTYGVTTMIYNASTNIVTVVLSTTGPFTSADVGVSYAFMNYVRPQGFAGVFKVLSVSTTTNVNDTFTYCPVESPAATSQGIVTGAASGTIVAGSGYTNGTYAGVGLTYNAAGTYGPGYSAIATITVSGGAVTAVNILAPGTNYNVGDVLTCANVYLGGTGSGFTFTISAGKITAASGAPTTTGYPGYLGAIQIRKANQKIKMVIDGVVDYNDANRTSGAGNGLIEHCVVMVGVRDFEIDVPGSIQNATKYCVYPSGINGLISQVVRTKGPSDGFHINGPINALNVEMCTGSNQDNQVAVNTSDVALYTFAEGPITNARFGVIACEDSGIPPIELTGSSGFDIDIEVESLNGGMAGPQSLLLIQSFAGLVPDSQTRVKRIRVNYAKGFSPTQTPLIDISANGGVQYCEFNNVTQLAPDGYAISVFCAVEQALVSNVTLVPGTGTTSIGVFMSTTGSINDLTLAKTTLPLRNNNTSTSMILVYNTGTIKKVTYRECHDIDVYQFLESNSGSVTGKISLESCLIENGFASVSVQQASGVVEFSAVNSSFRTTNGSGVYYLRNGGAATMNIRESNCDISYAGGTAFFNNGGGGTVALYGDDIQTDVTAAGVSTSAAGQFCYSTTVGANKQGLAVKANANATNTWYALATGAAGVNTLIV